MKLDTHLAAMGKSNKTSVTVVNIFFSFFLSFHVSLGNVRACTGDTNMVSDVCLSMGNVARMAIIVSPDRTVYPAATVMTVETIPAAQQPYKCPHRRQHRRRSRKSAPQHP